MDTQKDRLIEVAALAWTRDFHANQKGRPDFEHWTRSEAGYHVQQMRPVVDAVLTELGDPLAAKPLAARLEAALAKPTAETRDFQSEDEFDPWEDVIKGIYGSYASESDYLMIEALEAVRDKQTFEFIENKGFLGEFALYVLSGHGLLDYGSSPRGGWPEESIRHLWQPLIDKWKAYAEMHWGTAA